MKSFTKIAVFALLLLLVAFVLVPMTAEAKGNGGCKSYCSHNSCHSYCYDYCSYPWWYYNRCYTPVCETPVVEVPVCEVPVYTCEPTCFPTYSCYPNYCGKSYCGKSYCSHPTKSMKFKK